VAEQLLARGCDVQVLISPKEVDQQGVKAALGMEVVTLPAVALTSRQVGAFVTGFWKSFRAAKAQFRKRPPQAVLGMGGFTSAPPVLAGRQCGAATFLHESNTIPGRANRWLAHFVDQAFVGFPGAVGRLHHTHIARTGTPVRPQFQPADPAACRMALGLRADQPVLLVMGGSQGARGVNELVVQALPELAGAMPRLQFVHLTGADDEEKVRAAYAAHKVRAVVQAFLTEMELAMSAATVAVSRAGASSLAELAALRLPSLLIPYPTAADNHQFHNARAFVETGAARMMEQRAGSPTQLATSLLELLRDDARRTAMQQALSSWHAPDAAAHIAERILSMIQATWGDRWKAKGSLASAPHGVPPSGGGAVLPRTVLELSKPPLVARLTG
jgi:UDP-N-acetylglucosamine--N-acetylmuramyl-(pentapeptide) pyrophosphoryl-undecaprenol N-acetylglucosamine transferase